MVRRRDVEFLFCYGNSLTRNGRENFYSIAEGHESRSRFFKPQVSILAAKDTIHELLSDKEELEAKARKTGENQYIRLHVVADGRQAYVRRLL